MPVPGSPEPPGDPTIAHLYELRQVYTAQPVTRRTWGGALLQQGIIWGLPLAILVLSLASNPILGLLVSIIFRWGGSLLTATLPRLVLLPLTRWESWCAAQRLLRQVPNADEARLRHLEEGAAGQVSRSEDEILLYMVACCISGVAGGAALLQGWGLLAGLLTAAAGVSAGLGWRLQRRAQRAYILFLALGYYRQADHLASEPISPAGSARPE